MFVFDILVAIVVALVFSTLLTWLFRWQRPDREGAGAAFMFLFVVTFLAVWAGGAWIEPFGPIVGGVALMPFIIVGFIMALIFLALVPPPRRPRSRKEAIDQAEARAAAQVGAEAIIGAFFWVLLVVLLAAAIARYC